MKFDDPVMMTLTNDILGKFREAWRINNITYDTQSIARIDFVYACLFRTRPDEFSFTDGLFPAVINKFNEFMYEDGMGPDSSFWHFFGWDEKAK